VDDPATPGALLYLDLVGVYVVELRTSDGRGCEDSARVVVDAGQPGDGVHVELVWDTPGDADQADGMGTDVDLHFLHPMGMAWNAEPLDCYYANSRPEWGVMGPVNDPSLDIDDVDGAGPESLSFPQPEVTGEVPYRIGVHYYRAELGLNGENLGPSTATLRVFFNGERIHESARELGATGHFWEAAGLHWGDGPRVEVVDRYQEAFP